jgi:hypothetical protein
MLKRAVLLSLVVPSLAPSLAFATSERLGPPVTAAPKAVTQQATLPAIVALVHELGDAQSARASLADAMAQAIHAAPTAPAALTHR